MYDSMCGNFDYCLILVTEMLVNVLNLKGDDEDEMDLEDVEEPAAGMPTP